MPDGDGPQSPRRRKLHLLATEIGMTRDERIDLACYLLRRDITTWKTLDEDQVCRLLDAIEGWALIEEMIRQRGSSPNSTATAS
ncbi:MAG: hypothetical protein KJN63_10595 [Acidimicrobiia bacterium]|nr:hypothetical protein [Acidimicrobiia bacterium]